MTDYNCFIAIKVKKGNGLTGRGLAARKPESVMKARTVFSRSTSAVVTNYLVSILSSTLQSTPS